MTDYRICNVCGGIEPECECDEFTPTIEDKVNEVIKKNNNYIWITTRFEGIHKYPDAPNEVSFLRNEHRHIFHLKVYVEVFHNDRDIEFILFKRFIDTLLLSEDLNNKSCEMISDQIANEIKVQYPDRDIKIEVSEDLENGSYKEYEK